LKHTMGEFGLKASREKAVHFLSSYLCDNSAMTWQRMPGLAT
jgi:hypothetical protein